MIIVTGLGRCGTSILTKYFGELGFGLGQNVSWNKDVRAGMELSTAYTITHDLYHRFLKQGEEIDLSVEAWGDYWKGFTYRDAINAVDKDERQGKVDVFKDPRITWHPELIKAWWSVRQDIHLIICHRHIKDIMDSRLALPESFNDPKPRKELSEYQIDFAEFFTTVLKLDIPYEFLFFPKFIFDFEEVWWAIQNSGLIYTDYEQAKKIWEEIIDYKRL